MPATPTLLHREAARVKGSGFRVCNGLNDDRSCGLELGWEGPIGDYVGSKGRYLLRNIPEL